MISDIYISFIIILSVILIDQISKILAKKIIKKKTIYIFKKNFYLTYLENSGIAMGKFDGKYIYFYFATFISLMVFSYFSIYINFETNLLYSIGLSILIGGTIGNLIDRVLRGYVIDFITGKIFKKNLPVYNIADLNIFLGSIAIMIYFIICLF